MNPFEADKYFLQHIIQLKPYSSARDEYKGSEGIFLDANENPFGSATDEGKFNRYPDPLQKELKNQIAKLKGVESNQIFLGNGSDEPIDLLIRSTCFPGKDSIVQIAPSYGMYQVCADIHHVNLVSVQLEDDFLLNATKLIEAQQQSKAKLVFICSPNNPSGNAFEKSEIIKVIENVSALVVVDEAYIDFCPEKSMLNELARYPNLVVLQTFSKAWGLAALRLGMAFAHESIISVLNKIKYPYNLNILTQNTVLKALENAPRVARYAKQLNNLKADLIVTLSAMENIKKIYHSDANFVLVKFDKAKELFDSLINKKIITRDRSKVIMCEDCLRITIGTLEENDALIHGINDFYTSIA
ncbi:MAG: histidinol-phosphate transaminase [Cytophagales bacterium]